MEAREIAERFAATGPPISYYGPEVLALARSYLAQCERVRELEAAVKNCVAYFDGQPCKSGYELIPYLRELLPAPPGGKP